MNASAPGQFRSTGEGGRHAVVWIDQREAHVITFNRDQDSRKLVRHHAPPRQVRHKAGDWGSGLVTDDLEFLREVAASLQNISKILIVGPGHVKWQLRAYIEYRAPDLGRRIVGIEDSDHRSDAAILVLARKFFARRGAGPTESN